ncbi:hypothetical protein PGT21_027926 [Puccinia graminis f. sp. tritici]|uniref:PUM-HD domain-containing protein n=1 Tax=Puccinia graminis f. sp. tritici TaxID=56615 RepID=A0A5B0M4N1_PUCGR|nr:hypothetical protein PGT21_027926 [Puccinia graminis f. sp. tritici]KAA1135222.1 hypothetical protein PGTUg99_016889 [Puccinia graminis f. sp. tritici]
MSSPANNNNNSNTPPLLTNNKNNINNQNNNQNSTRTMGEMTRAEAIGLYRTGNLSSLPQSATSNTTHPSPTTTTHRTNNSTSTARRPRAGTLPSSFNSLSSSASSPLNALNHTPSRPDLLRQFNLLTPGASLPSTNSLLSIGSAGLYGSTSMQDARMNNNHMRSDMNLHLSLDKTRARAGTVALPPSSASSYFGRGVFSTNFVPRSSRMNEELRSIRSDDSALGESEDPDEAGHVRTLDYLGLDADSPVSPTVPNQPQSAFVGSSGFYHVLNGPAGYPQPAPIGSSNSSLSALANRMRASTISGVAPSPSSLRRQSNNLRASPFPSEENLYTHSGGNSPSILEDDYAAPLGSANSLASQYATSRQQQLDAMQAEVHDKQMSAYSAMLNSNSSNGLLTAPISRPRANTLGGASLLAGMGAPTTPIGFSAAAAAAAVRNRAGTLAGFSKHSGFLNSLNSPSNESHSNHNLNPLNYQNWMSASRPITPDFNMAGMMQQPSRSLWIGNFDPSTTAQELMNVFAVYGPIESLRLLPDKECGFINFVSVHDAVHAKDDIVNRLEGQINLKNGPTCIRIGFGKPESAPQTPASLLTTPIGSARGGSGLVNGLSQTMMMLSLTNIPGPNGIVSSSQINNICPNPSGYTNVGGVMLGPNGDPILQSSPTRALWVGSIPSQTTPNHLMDIFSPYGAIESVRVLSHKNCGFINFEHLDDAVRARKALSGREILGSEVGAVKIGYAKVPVKAPGTFSPSAQMDGLTQDQQMAQQQLAYETLARIKGASAVPLDQQILSGSIQDYRSNLAMSFIPNGIHALNGFPLGGSIPNTSAAFPLATSAMVPNESSTSIDREAASSTICTTPLPSVTEMQLLMKELCRDPSNKSDEAVEKEYEEDKLSVAEFRPPVTYYTTVPPPLNQLDPHRRLVSAVSDPARLREIRKRFDSNTLSQEEMDQIASELLEEIIYLSSDYIGNTIVQKLFEKCSHPIKMMMLERCAPHLAIIGCHKNGTWAAQKMIDCASTAEEMKLISQNLRPFGPPLLLDSLGNYVMQCCLRFGSPYNDFVFDAIVDRIWEVAQGRFGARSVRTCLESKHALPLQIKRVAIAVILNSIPLATNPNGTLLLTWLLDSSGLAGRYRLLAPRLAPHLAHLCTHKLASVTVLRIINQNFDPIASRIIVDGIFHSNKSVLEEILGDQAHGVNLISKTLTSSFLSIELKADISEKIKEMIVSLRVQHIPAYKKLAEEVGVVTTSASSSSSNAGMTGGGSTPVRSLSGAGGGNHKPSSGRTAGEGTTGTLWASSSPVASSSPGPTIAGAKLATPRNAAITPKLPSSSSASSKRPHHSPGHGSPIALIDPHPSSSSPSD